MTSVHPAECRDPVCPLPHGMWTTTPDATLGDFHAAHPVLKAAAARGDTTCWVGSRRWTWVSAQTAPRPAINAELLGRAIREHRQAEFDPHAVISMTHLCFDDCAENIAARYDELARAR